MKNSSIVSIVIACVLFVGSGCPNSTVEDPIENNDVSDASSDEKNPRLGETEQESDAPEPVDNPKSACEKFCDRKIECGNTEITSCVEYCEMWSSTVSYEEADCGAAVEEYMQCVADDTVCRSPINQGCSAEYDSSDTACPNTFWQLEKDPSETDNENGCELSVEYYEGCGFPESTVEQCLTAVENSYGLSCLVEYTNFVECFVSSECENFSNSYETCRYLEDRAFACKLNNSTGD